jgi:translation initiation factor eIF-2B subunit alpha
MDVYSLNRAIKDSKDVPNSNLDIWTTYQTILRKEEVCDTLHTDLRLCAE